MSNIYVQEPPALGKVLLKTTVGDIDLELWTKETPKACRNFIQLCMEGYYNKTIFHRVVPDFIVQGGDPNGDGTGGESIYGSTFKDEFHTRLRFNRRGLVAMANAGKDDNGSQFFFTLNTTPELQNKHTIFGKVTGETIYNVLKLAEGDIDENERPAYPHKIISCEILVNPFDDIVPRAVEKPVEVTEKQKKKEKGIKNFGLLSFGMEAEEDEDQSMEFRGKPKSTHDLLDDPKLSKLTTIDVDSEENKNADGEERESEVLGPDAIANIRDKLKSKNKNTSNTDDASGAQDDEEVEEYYLGKDKKEARQKQVLVIREQIKELKKEMSGKKNVVVENTAEKETEKVVSKPMNDMMENYESEQEKYKKKMDEMPKKGVSRVKQRSMQQNNIPGVKKLYEHNSEYPDNYTDERFLQQLRKNIHVYEVTFLQCLLGSCRITQKVSTCILFSIIFTYMYNEWVTAEYVFGISSIVTLLGYILFLFVSYVPDVNDKSLTNDAEINDPIILSEEEKLIDSLMKKNIEKHARKFLRKKNYPHGKVDKTKLMKKNNSNSGRAFMKFIFEDFKMVLIYLVFGYIFSPILHSLTDTVSTDTIFATALFMMLIHLIFSDYGLSVAVVSNSLSINSAIFGSICLASRLSNPFCAFVLLTLSVLAFVLSPILIKMIWNTNYATFVFCKTALVTFVSLWIVSRTMFCFFVFTVVFLNIFCPYLFVKWQKYKNNIYGPWDEAIVHDSDDISDCVLIQP